MAEYIDLTPKAFSELKRNHPKRYELYRYGYVLKKNGFTPEQISQMIALKQSMNPEVFEQKNMTIEDQREQIEAMVLKGHPIGKIAKLTGFSNRQIADKLKELSSLCGLSEIMHRPVSELSKGLNQRVGLAHAMISDPEILILDEPTSGLDPNQIVEIRKIIKNIGKEKTIILSTHILSEAEATCDRILIIDKGRIVADDTPKNLKKSAKTESHITLSLNTADHDIDVKKAEDIIKSIDKSIIIKVENRSEQGVITFTIKASDIDDPMKKIYLAIKETDFIISEFKKESQSLENIFHKLTTEGLQEVQQEDK